MARTKKVEENIEEKEITNVKIEDTVSIKDFKELQEQMKKMMVMLESKQSEIDELKKKEEENKKVERKITNKKEIDLEREVEVRTICQGSTSLVGQYINYEFAEYGDSYPIPLRDLRYINNNYPMIFKKPFVIIEDEEAVKMLGLTKFYESISYIDDLKTFFDNNEKGYILKKLKETPEFLRLELFGRIKNMWNDKDEAKRWRDLDVAYLLRDNFGFNLLED